MANMPEDHADFYMARLRRLIRAGARSVLVSGTVGYGMPAIVFAAFAAEQVTGNVTVLDLCETPLRLCRWYADRIGVDIETAAADILDYAPGPRFDAICTHAFFGFFDDLARSRLVAGWRDMLLPGGEVLTMNRLRPDATRQVGFSPIEGEEFAERVVTEMRRRGMTDEAVIAETLDLARDYPAYHLVYPVTSERSFAAPFIDSGFDVDVGTVTTLDGSATGPTVRGGTYVTIVARRR
jgi:hypothetical protein